MGGDANQVDDESNRRANVVLPINLLKMAKITHSGSMYRNASGIGYIHWTPCIVTRVFLKLVYAGVKA